MYDRQWCRPLNFDPLSTKRAAIFGRNYGFKRFFLKTSSVAKLCAPRSKEYRQELGGSEAAHIESQPTTSPDTYQCKLCSACPFPVCSSLQVLGTNRHRVFRVVLVIMSIYIPVRLLYSPIGKFDGEIMAKRWQIEREREREREQQQHFVRRSILRRVNFQLKPFSILHQSKPVTPRRRWGIPTDASDVTVTHRRLSSATRSNDDIDWQVHSLRLSFHDLRFPLRRLPLTEPCSMIFGSVSWRHTRPNHDNLRLLTIENRSFWGPARILTCCQTYSFVLCSLYDMPNILL